MAKWRLYRVMLDKCGYTLKTKNHNAGYYYGVGDPVWIADPEEYTNVNHEFRAKTRDEAKQYVVQNFDKDAKFYG